jgi:glycyl-tRNA synthetase beta chain
VLEKGLVLDLGAVFRTPGQAAQLQPATMSQLLDFIWQRAAVIFEEKGYKFDEIKAVRESFIRSGDLLDCSRRLAALHAARGNAEFEALAAAFKRARNILKQAKHSAAAGPDEAVFERDEERALYSDIKALSGRLKDYNSARDYVRSLGDVVSIKPALDNFFEKVMVMDENPAVRENRLKLVNSVVSLFEDVADLSQLQ